MDLFRTLHDGKSYEELENEAGQKAGSQTTEFERAFGDLASFGARNFTHSESWNKGYENGLRHRPSAGGSSSEVSSSCSTDSDTDDDYDDWEDEELSVAPSARADLGPDITPGELGAAFAAGLFVFTVSTLFESSRWPEPKEWKVFGKVAGSIVAVILSAVLVRHFPSELFAGISGGISFLLLAAAFLAFYFFGIEQIFERIDDEKYGKWLPSAAAVLFSAVMLILGVWLFCVD